MSDDDDDDEDLKQKNKQIRESREKRQKNIDFNPANFHLKSLINYFRLAHCGKKKEDVIMSTFSHLVSNGTNCYSLLDPPNYYVTQKYEFLIKFNDIIPSKLTNKKMF